MSKFNLFFTVFLLGLATTPASAMFTRMRSAFKPLAAATARRLTPPRIAGLAVGAGALYATNNMRRAQALEAQKVGELPDAEKYSELRKFFEKHQCSQELRQILEKEQGNITDVKDGRVCRYDNIPFYRKSIADFERVYNAWRMKRFFEQHNLSTLAAAHKCLCNVGNEWHVIAAAVSRGQERKFSKKEVEEVIVVVDQTRYSDWHSENIVRDERGILTFVDTEQRSFNRLVTKQVLLASISYYISLENDGITREWFNDLLVRELKIDRPCGWHQGKYDDPGIDFEQVKKEFKLWQKEMAQQKALDREGG